MIDLRHSVTHRKQALTRLLAVVQKHEKNVINALYNDFQKPEFEAVVTETSYVISDLKHTIRKLKSWAKPTRVIPSLLNFPSSDYIYSEPYGKVLIVAPWNYPFMLALCPVIAAVAAGNQVVLKPSELAPNIASILEIIISEAFDPTEVEVFQGGAEVSQMLINRKWDYIFFTGSVAVGRIVAEAAAKSLTPVTLELGGKSPCIVDESADLEITARRIIWGKFINAGQTCLAPDYIIAHHGIREDLMERLSDEITRAYGEHPEQSEDFARIISDRHFARLQSMIDPSKVYFGGSTDPASRYISPTIINDPNGESAAMHEEIFGPLLPVLSYRDESEIERIVSRHEKPLSFYVFTRRKAFADNLIRKFPFGGGCINDVVIHVANRRLPFGGIGASGMGAYHGRTGFDTFSHRKSIVKRGTWIDLPIRYAPYKDKLGMVRRLLSWF